MIHDVNRRGAEDAEKDAETEPEAGLSRVNRRGAEDAEKDAETEPEAGLNRLTQAVIGAAIEVHRVLGPGYLESVYEEAICVELQLRGVPFVRQVAMDVSYKGHAVGEGRLDLLVGGHLIVELKAVEALAPIHTAQVISYLKATGHHLGLLINFNVLVLRQGIRRVVLSQNRTSSPRSPSASSAPLRFKSGQGS
ncbi:MAG: GxxExxY protein [Chloroflexi bacterium]|nr:GxxExxY protein [Chloroflexota bacterium]